MSGHVGSCVSPHVWKHLSDPSTKRGGLWPPPFVESLWMCLTRVLKRVETHAGSKVLGRCGQDRLYSDVSLTLFRQKTNCSTLSWRYYDIDWDMGTFHKRPCNAGACSARFRFRCRHSWNARPRRRGDSGSSQEEASPVRAGSGQVLAAVAESMQTLIINCDSSHPHVEAASCERSQTKDTNQYLETI